LSGLISRNLETREDASIVISFVAGTILNQEM
jgi:hypothetical protein